MKAIILAAGKGTRLLPLTQQLPKSLLVVGDTDTLLEMQLARLQAAGIDEAVVVVGHLASQIEAKLATLTQLKLSTKTVFNPRFGRTNNLVSLWCARHEMTEDFIVTNGDTLCTGSTYARLVREVGDGIHLVVAPASEYNADNMKVQFGTRGLLRVSKLIDPTAAQGASPGLVLVRGDQYRVLFCQAMEALFSRPAHLQQYWLELFNWLASEGFPVLVHMMDTTESWQEIDVAADLAQMRDVLCHPIPMKLFKTPTGDFYLPTNVPRDAVFRAIVGGRVHGEKAVNKVVALIRPGATVIDVGSYYGQDTVLFSKALGASGGKIHTIEASGRVLTILKRNLAMNVCDNVVLHHNAAWHISGEQLYLDVPKTTHSAWVAPKATSGELAESLKVDDLALDNVCVMKVDAEGADLRVLQGSVETIRRCQMPIVFEYCPAVCGPIYGICWADHLAFIKSVGYKLAEQVDAANFLMEPK